MKLIGSRHEAEFRSELIESRRALMERNEYPGLLTAVQDLFPRAQTIFVLQWVPEQSEEFVQLLVDADTVLELEVDRQAFEVVPGGIMQKSVEAYKKSLSKISQLQLAVALDLASTGRYRSKMN